MRVQYFIIFFAGLLLAAGCSRRHELSPAGQTFVNQSSMGLYGDGVSYMQYEKFSHQFYRNYSGTEFRLSNDNLEVYFSCVFSSAPSMGSSIDVHIETAGLGLEGDIDGVFYVAKVDGNLCWMWCEEENIGIVAYVEH